MKVNEGRVELEIFGFFGHTFVVPCDSFWIVHLIHNSFTKTKVEVRVNGLTWICAGGGISEQQ